MAWRGALPSWCIERIEFDAVDFVYGNRIAVLAEVALAFERDRVTALVGHGGSDKSTQAVLLCCHHDPVRGVRLFADP